MKYIESIREGEKVADIYFCKSKISALTKNGKPYESLTLQDKTGTVDAKIWDPNSLGIDDFDSMDYIDIVADVVMFGGGLQLNIKRVRRAGEGEYDPREYLPVSEKNIDEMYDELKKYIDSVKNTYMNKLLNTMLVEDSELIKKYKASSAAKTVHHGFIGGLLEHTLSVVKISDFVCGLYPVINRDLLLTSAMLHDIGKTVELSSFPINDYTDDGNLLGHIVLGSEMVGKVIDKIDGFPRQLAGEIKHCILSHHGELEYGSPKKPGLIEAVALSYIDNLDAKLETMKELLASAVPPVEGSHWIGYNRFLESNIRRTTVD